MRRLAGILISILFLASALFGQDTRATLTGAVTDSQGAAIPGASVVVKNTATNFETKASTNESGVYLVPFLTPGTYSVTVTVSGFKTALKDRLELNISERHQLDFRMEVGGITEQVIVSAQADLLNTASASGGTTIDAQKVADLPLLGKNPYTFAYHAAGVTHINPQGSITDRPYDNGGMDAINIAGGRAFTNEYLLDGAPNTNVERGNVNSLSFVPPPEAVEEVAVQNNNYDAQYGRTGGGVISSTLKSGTNTVHGAVYEYHRNRVLNANFFQNNRQGLPRGPFIWNQPGATVNGPVYLPKLYNGRNKTFFLFAWEAIKQNIPNATLQTVPTQLNRNGDFSDLHQTNGAPIIIYDPLTTGQGGGANLRTAFPGNKIPSNRFDQVALKMLSFIPLPNCAPNAQGFQNYCPASGTVTRERYNSYTTKVDQVLNNTNRLALSYVRNRRWQTGPDYGWPVPAQGPNNFQRFNQGSNLQWTSTLSPTTVLTTRFGFTQHDFANFMYGGGYDATTLGLPASFVSAAQGQFFPTLTFSSYTGFGQAGNNHDTSTNWYVTATANRAVRSHSLKWGIDLRNNLDNLPNYSLGTFGFTNGWTQANSQTADAASGNAFASFLLGYLGSGTTNYNATPAWGYRVYGVFFQDDWRVSRTLTLNLGLRWDYEGPVTERYNRINGGFDANATSPLNIPGYPLKGGLTFLTGGDRLSNNRDLNNFAPRLGVAWHPLKKTVFRGGYGLSYVPTFVAPSQSGFAASTSSVTSLDGNQTPSGHLFDPFPAGLNQPSGSTQGLATFIGQGVSYIYPDRRIPYIQQFSFGFQHELPSQVLLDVSYVGSRTDKLAVSKNLNNLTVDQLAQGTAYLNTLVTNPFFGYVPATVAIGASKTVTRRTLLVPFPQFTSVTRNGTPIGHSWYNSLQVQVTKRLSHGLHLQANYTYSATMEAVSYLNNQFTDDQLERVRTAEDLPHRFNILAGYILPFFKDSKGFKKALLGGWQVQAIGIYQTGRQLSGVDAYPTGVDWSIPGATFAPDTAVFNACTLTTAGVRQSCTSADQPVAWIQRQTDTLRVTSTRWTQIREHRPGSWDASIFKAFRPREKLEVQFRCEAFNVTNTPWFGVPNSSLGNARFGLANNSQSNDPRNIQVALKIAF